MTVESALLASDTSHAAKLSIKPHVSRLQRVVLDAIRLHQKLGATDDEIEQITGLLHTTASARRRELVLAGSIYDSGERRLTRSKRSAIVWRSVERTTASTLEDRTLL